MVECSTPPVVLLVRESASALGLWWCRLVPDNPRQLREFLAWVHALEFDSCDQSTFSRTWQLYRSVIRSAQYQRPQRVFWCLRCLQLVRAITESPPSADEQPRSMVVVEQLEALARAS
jgi:hypothetical protein